MAKWYTLVLLLLFNCCALAQERDLDFYLATAIQNSPLLRDYSNQVESNRMDSSLIQSSYRPQVNSFTSGVYAPVINGWGYDVAITNGHTFSTVISVSQTLVGHANISNQYEGIGLQNSGLHTLQKVSEQDIRKDITDKYVLVYGDKLQLDFNQELLDLLKDEEKILRKLTESSTYRQTDFLSFLVTLKQQELTVQQWEARELGDLSALNYAAGISDTSNVGLAAPVIPLPGYPRAGETIFIQKFRIDSLLIEANNKQIDFNYRPKLSLFADGGYNSSFAIQSYRNFGVSAGATLTVPLYDGKQRALLHHKNEISERTRQNYHQFFIHQYDQQLAGLKQQLDLAEQLEIQASEQVKYAEELMKAQRTQLLSGDVRMADYILSMGNYLNAKNAVTQNQINKWLLASQVNYWNRTN